MVIHLGNPFSGAFMVHSDSYLYLSRHNIHYFCTIVPKTFRQRVAQSFVEQIFVLSLFSRNFFLYETV